MGILVNQNQIGGGGSSNSSHNIGDIFYTTRTDNSLNGAVECNGSQYNFSDFDSNLQALFDDGKLPYLPIGKFDEMVTNQGGCDSFGYDSGATYFKVPKKLGRVLVRTQKPKADYNYTWYNVYSDGWVEQGGTVNGRTSATATFPVEMADTRYTVAHGNRSVVYEQVMTGTKTTTSITVKSSNSDRSVSTDWQVSGYAASSEYAQSTWEYQNVQVERPMVQLFNGATDEALATCTEVLADVAGLKQTTGGMIDYVVESQEPTEANGYTWYRLYKSGWVEQGGSVPVSGNKAQLTGVIELPIQMQTDKATQPFATYKYLSGQSYTIVTAYYNSSRTNVVATAQIMGSQSQSSGTLSVIASGYAV